MKLLFDHNVPHKLRQYLLDHEVNTADEMGWATLENGQLLKAAENAQFDVMLTCDQNLSYQQNLQGRNLALVVLSTNNWNTLKRKVGPIVAAIDAAKRGSFQFVPVENIP